MNTHSIDHADHQGAADTLFDRRRPGRRADVNPALIPLLRGTASGSVDLFLEMEDEPNALSAAKGSIVAVLLSAVFWGVLGVLFFLL